jgi:thiamine pyrophosphate-dependent acetolactate synthase large subunit-like protein
VGAARGDEAASGTVITAGELLARWLRVRGVDAVYGRPLPGLPVVEVDDPNTARLLAMAHRRVHGVAAAVHGGAGRLSLLASDAADAAVIAVDSAPDLLDVSGAGQVTLELDLDLAAPAPDVVPPAPTPAEVPRDPDPDHVKRLASARAPVVLAGPGVVDNRAASGLNALAAAGGLGVLNTWGAKGVVDWRSRHHWATVGLQARDFELGGLGNADLIVATGIDPREAPAERWQVAPVLDVAPQSLGPLAEQCARPDDELAMPPLRAALAAVTQQGWATETEPLAPTRATLHYARCFGSGGLVAADPGVAGYWVARTVATTELGTVQVPAVRDAEGFAPACALVARLRHPWRAALAAVDGPLRPAVRGVLETADRLGVSVPLEAWHGDGGPTLSADAHLERLRKLALAERPVPASLAVDGSQLARMIDVAGPIVAWGGLPDLPS